MAKHEEIRYIEYTIGGLSLLGSFFNIICFIFFKSIRCFAFEMVFYLSLSCMLTNISYLLNVITDDNDLDETNLLCKIQGFGIIWFEHSQFIWATLIAYSIYKNVINFDKKVERTQLRTRLIFLFLGYIFPLSLALLIYFTDNIGNSGYWCWIKTKGKKKDIKDTFIYIMNFYGIMWILFFISVFFIFRVVHFLKNLYISKDEKELIIKYTSKLKIFPLIQIFTLLPSMIKRITQYICNDDHFSFIDYFIVVLISSQGLVYAIVYGFNPKVRNKLISFVESWICCMKEKDKESLVSLNTEIMEYGENSFQSNQL